MVRAFEQCIWALEESAWTTLQNCLDDEKVVPHLAFEIQEVNISSNMPTRRLHSH